MGKRSVELYCEEGVWGLLSCGLVGAVNLLGLVERCWDLRLERELLDVRLVGVVPWSRVWVVVVREPVPQSSSSSVSVISSSVSVVSLSVSIKSRPWEKMSDKVA
jgi:hypothetical protein